MKTDGEIPSSDLGDRGSVQRDDFARRATPTRRSPTIELVDVGGVVAFVLVKALFPGVDRTVAADVLAPHRVLPHDAA